MRSKLLPRGGQPIDWSPIERRLREILAGTPTGEIRRTKAFWELWEAQYPQLSADHPGLLGAILGRAEAQVLRLALTYALLDRQPQKRQAFIDECHLRAALACWKYAEASARFIFGDALGDPVADEILRAVRAAGKDGMTRTGIRDLFKRNCSAERLGAALDLLASRNLARRRSQETGGRPSEVWESI